VPAQAERLLLRDGQLQAYVPEGSGWCAPEVNITLRSSDPGDFRDTTKLQTLLGGLRAALSFECPAVTALRLSGSTPAGEAFLARAGESGGWNLEVLAPVSAPMPASALQPERAPERAAAPEPAPAAPERAPAPAPAALMPVAEADADQPELTPSLEQSRQSRAMPWFAAIVVAIALSFALMLMLRRRGHWPAWRWPSSAGAPPEAAGQSPATPTRHAGASRSTQQDTTAPTQTDAPTASDATPPADTGAPDQAPEPAISGDTLKHQLLAQQRAKYEHKLGTLLDDLTQCRVALEAQSKVPARLRDDLHKLAGQLRRRVRALLRRQHGNLRSALRDAALLLPFFRAIRRGPPIISILLIGGGIVLLLRGLGLISYGDYLPVVVSYLIYVAIFGFLGVRRNLSEAIRVFKEHAGSLGMLGLFGIRPDRAPAQQDDVLHYEIFRIWSDRKKPLPDMQAAWPVTNVRLDPEKVYLLADEFAGYELHDTGHAELAIGAENNLFLRDFRGVLEQVLAERPDALADVANRFRAYASMIWRERRYRDEIPRIESLLENVSHLENIWLDVAVADRVFDFLLRRIDLFNLRDLATPPGILLTGYPGNGKRYLARKIAQSVFAKFVSISASDLATPDAVREIWSEHRGGTSTVFFVDHAEQLLPKPGSEHADGGTREATLAWLEAWSQADAATSRIWVIMTARSEDEVHPRILERFSSSRVEISSPDHLGRTMILQAACHDNGLTVPPPQWLIDNTGGATVRELHEIVKEAKLVSLPQSPNDEHWRQAIEIIRGSDAGFRDENKTWNRIVLPEEIKSQLQRTAKILQQADQYRAQGVRVPNILLYGPPGTGKTDIARTLANECGVKFLAASTADMKAEYLGQSTHRVKDVFARARASAPCILFIDEIDSVAPKRGGEQADKLTNEIVNQMLQEMDGARQHTQEVFVLGATNLPEQIDPAILSRFTSRIEIPLPDLRARTEILSNLLGERRLEPGLDIEEIAGLLARKLKRRSGRDLVMLINRAMERAVMNADSPSEIALTRDLLLAEVNPQSQEIPEAELAKVWSQIVLAPKVKKSLMTKIRLFNSGDKAAPRGLLLYGPPGTGKTEVARRLAESTRCHFMALSGPDLKSQYIGGSGQNVRQIWDQARSRGRCVLFVDECEGVFSRRGANDADSASDETVQAFLSEWDGVASEGQIWVVGATNRRDRLDDAIVSRFGAAVEIGLPGPDQRLQILALELAKLEREADIPDFIVRATTGMSGRGLSSLARDVCTLAAEHGGELSEAIWREVLAQHISAGSEAVDEDARWDSLILAQETLEHLQTVCYSLTHLETLQKQGHHPPKGALLYGPPGTGKTQIARTLANESGLPFVAASTADLKAGYVGQSVNQVKQLFERARSQAPCILFIDEIEAVAPSRSGRMADQFTHEIVTQLLQELDGVRKAAGHIYLLAATNLPEMIDSAIRSRFEDEIEIPAPDDAQREALFRVFLKRQQGLEFDVDQMAAELARRSGQISGRDVRKIVQRASQRALRRAMRTGTVERVVLIREDFLAEVANCRAESADSTSNLASNEAP